MAKGFFENFPTMVYDNDGKGQYKEVVDIFRRVSLRNNLKNYIQMPLLQSIDGTQKPERLANLVHGDPKRNWLVMMMNDVENPYTDWFMGEEEFYKYMLEKYPDKVINILVSSHSDIFLVGEKLHIIDGSFTGPPLTSNPTAEVTGFDATLKTITYKLVKDPDNIENDMPNFSNTDPDTFIYGVSSKKTATIQGGPISEFNAPHHIDVDGNIVENWDYEFNLNEAKSQVSVLNNDYIDRIEDEFKKRIT